MSTHHRASHPACPITIAHRGARAYAPENTLEAFQKAAQLGADMIELDVQLTGDGELIVLHDASLERCSNARDRFPNRSDFGVTALSAAEIRQLDAGSWFVRELDLPAAERQPFLRSITGDERVQFISQAERNHYASGLVRHPSLREVFDALRLWNIRANIELKAHDHVTPKLCDRTIELIREFDLADRVLVSSFDHAALTYVHERDAKLAIGVLVTAPPADPVQTCRALGASAYHPGCYGRYDAVGFSSETFRRTGRLPAELFRACRAANIDVFAWTENDPARIRALIEAGVSGIFTDYPNRLKNDEARITNIDGRE